MIMNYLSFINFICLYEIDVLIKNEGKIYNQSKGFFVGLLNYFLGKYSSNFLFLLEPLSHIVSFSYS